MVDLRNIFKVEVIPETSKKGQVNERIDILMRTKVDGGKIRTIKTKN